MYSRFPSLNNHIPKRNKVFCFPVSFMNDVLSFYINRNPITLSYIQKQFVSSITIQMIADNVCLYFPYNEKNIHWKAFVANFNDYYPGAKKTGNTSFETNKIVIDVLDSGSHIREIKATKLAICLGEILTCALYSLNFVNNKSFDFIPPKIEVNFPKVITQKNACDCGIFLMLFLLMIVSNESFTTSVLLKQSSEQQRKFIATRCLRQHLIPMEYYDESLMNEAWFKEQLFTLLLGETLFADLISDDDDDDDDDDDAKISKENFVPDLTHDADDDAKIVEENFVADLTHDDDDYSKKEFYKSLLMNAFEAKSYNEFKTLEVFKSEKGLIVFDEKGEIMLRCYERLALRYLLSEIAVLQRMLEWYYNNKLSFDEKKLIVVEYDVKNSDCFWDAIYKQWCNSTKSMSNLKSEFKNYLSKFIKKIEDDDIKSREREIKDLQHIFKKNANISKLNILLPILASFLKSNIKIWSFTLFKDEVKLMIHKDCENNYICDTNDNAYDRSIELLYFKRSNDKECYITLFRDGSKYYLKYQRERLDDLGIQRVIDDMDYKFTVVDVKKNGNCFWNALAFSIAGNEDLYKEIKETFFKYVEDEANLSKLTELTSFLNTVIGIDRSQERLNIPNYLKKYKKDREFIDDAELVINILNHALQCNIVIWQINQELQFCAYARSIVQENYKTTCNLFFDAPNVHYLVLLSYDEK